MARIPLLDREISLDLAGHVTAQVHVAESVTLVSEVEDNSASKLVVGGSGAVSRLENVNAIPFAGALGTGSDTWNITNQPEFISLAWDTPWDPEIILILPFFRRTTPANPSSKSQK